MTARKKKDDLLKVGRKSDFKTEYVKKAYELSILGLTDVQMAGVFGVTERTLNTWKKKYPEFLQSLKKGKDDADSKVANSLFNRAIGYDYEEVAVTKRGRKVVNRKTTTKQMPPDTTAAIFWLKNRQPELWRDKVVNELTGKDGKDLEPTVIILPSNNRDDKKESDE